jgi:predicted O-linked N-acetylglucosamine transferase (SPINDLY family)
MNPGSNIPRPCGSGKPHARCCGAPGAIGTLQETLQAALQHHQAGRLSQAESLYRQVLNQQPEHAEALQLLGMVAHHVGDHEQAVKLIRRAITLQPAAPHFYCNLALALTALDQTDEAIHAYRQALQRKPEYAEACYNLGILQKKQGLLEEAIGLFEQRLKPDFAPAYNSLGKALQEQGQLDRAANAFLQALKFNPEYVEAFNNLGVNHLRQGDANEALSCCKKALSLKPDYVPALNNMGRALANLGQDEMAISYLERALEHNPDSPIAYNNLGNILDNMGQAEKALDLYKKGLRLEPDNAVLNLNAGKALYSQGKLDAAADAFEKSLELDPHSPQAHSNLLLTLNYSSACSPEVLYEKHREFDTRHARPLAGHIRPHGNSRDPARRLKIGYVSPDFRTHSVAFFIEPVLAHHDPERFEIFAYYNHQQSDAITEKLKGHCHHWCSICNMPDEQVAERIRRDGIDILVDLAGHTANNRLLVFAYKPAPVQVSWLGYPNTTGLSTMDYRLTDAWADPDRSLLQRNTHSTA